MKMDSSCSSSHQLSVLAGYSAGSSFLYARVNTNTLQPFPGVPGLQGITWKTRLERERKKDMHFKSGLYLYLTFVGASHCGNYVVSRELRKCYWLSKNQHERIASGLEIPLRHWWLTDLDNRNEQASYRGYLEVLPSPQPSHISSGTFEGVMI